MHYRLLCKVCRKIIVQCPCSVTDKTERTVLCADCLAKAADAAQKLTVNKG